MATWEEIRNSYEGEHAESDIRDEAGRRIGCVRLTLGLFWTAWSGGIGCQPFGSQKEAEAWVRKRWAATDRRTRRMYGVAD
jgi:hypothetical protein